MDLIGGGPAAGFLLTVLFLGGVALYAILPVIAVWLQWPLRDWFHASLLRAVWAPMAVHLSVTGVAAYLYRSDAWQVEHTRTLVAVACGAAIACSAWSHFRAKALAR